MHFRLHLILGQFKSEAGTATLFSSDNVTKGKIIQPDHPYCDKLIER